ncbi:uncharacterized protein LOC123878552 [Maniola jurtina]|uniref:uncharacterized protein LOC123878552 n=1 Tax=Maniola jurtina TaxID=191418 RepID=UPI001E68689F|nr:uncharacterized protein LOC123878552 [Maniola jurtina]
MLSNFPLSSKNQCDKDRRLRRSVKSRRCKRVVSSQRLSRVSRSIISPAKVRVCRRAATMLPGPLAPLDARKTRALTTIYAPRKPKPRNHKTAQSRMLENDIKTTFKTSLSTFHPLPAIGQKQEKTKVIIFDLKNEDRTLKLQEVLKPLTPLSIQGFRKKIECDKKPQQLLRENTYDVIEPIFLTPKKVKKNLTPCNSQDKDVKMSPKSRFKNAALQVAKLTSMPETGKLLCLRERETYTICREDDSCRLQKLPQSPAQPLNKLSEIFQSLDMKGRHRDRMKKENSWF